MSLNETEPRVSHFKMKAIFALFVVVEAQLVWLTYHVEHRSPDAIQPALEFRITWPEIRPIPEPPVYY